MLGKLLDASDDPPVRLSAAAARLRKVKSFSYLILGIGVLGFALVSVPVRLSFLLDEGYGFDAYKRGWLLSLMYLPALLVIPFAGRYGDRAFRRDPRNSVRIMGVLVIAYGVFLTVGSQLDSIELLVVLIAIANACQLAAFTQVGPIISAVVPYRMRAQAFALIGFYIFLLGGFFGGLAVAAIADDYGERTALLVVVPFAALVGGILVLSGSRFMKRDISLVVEELLDEQEEQRRVAADPEDVPVLQVHNLDVSYGPLQVLFDVNMEVRRGEVLALLGTNGAGKSTLLRAVSGLRLPRPRRRPDERAHDHAHRSPDPGGDGHDPDPRRRGAVPEPDRGREPQGLEPAHRGPDAARAERIEAALETFPAVRARLKYRAGSLSGGEQQMLALSKAVMLDPEILLIDELSLGLAPLVVQQLLAVIERLKAQGLTMVIVEQSVNVALAVADRAVFMERGRVRFEGPAQELLERGDLLRAVFLSGEGA